MRKETCVIFPFSTDGEEELYKALKFSFQMQFTPWMLLLIPALPQKLSEVLEHAQRSLAFMFC